MRFLFLLISLLYSYIFYCFHTLFLKKDIFWKEIKNSLYDILEVSIYQNWFIKWDKETVIIQSIFWINLINVIFFFLIWIWLFVFFWWKKFKKEVKKEEEILEKNSKINFSKEKFILFIKNFSHYIWFILFYLSIYFISRSFWKIHFWYLIFIINLVVYLFFYFSKYSKTAFNFFRINSILFSSIYVFFYLYIIISKNNFFQIIDFINSFIIIGTFPVYVYFDRKINKQHHVNNSIITHFSIYIFWVFLFYLNLIFENAFVFWISIILSIFGYLWFNIFPKFKIFKWNKYILKYTWIIFSYIWSVFWVIFLFQDFSVLSLIIIWILIFQIYYNFLIHNKYSNYISYILSIFLSIFLIYYLVLEFLIKSIKLPSFFIFWIVLSIILILITYFAKMKHMLDYFIIHIFSYIINISGIIIYLIFNFSNLNFLYIWIFLFVECLYFFASYNKLKS